MKIGRNDLCWCGSGKKFKKCHLGRSGMQRPGIQEAVAEDKRLTSKAYCLHPNAKSGGCRGEIVQAHTIQRNGGLSRIARNGHVYTFMGNRVSVLKSGVCTPTLVGLRAASTFTGFCAHHDDTTFAPIEKQSFEANAEHAFLLGYRILCRELYGKKMQSEQVAFLKTLDRGLPPAAQARLQEQVRRHEAAVVAGLRDAEVQKDSYDRALVSRDYSDVQYYIVRFATAPDFLCAAGGCPKFDFSGRQLQDYADLQKRLDLVMFSLIPTEAGGAAVFSWVGRSRAIGQFIRSLDIQSDDQMTHSIVRYAFECENSYFSPDWWEGLGERTRDALEHRFKTSVDLGAELKPTHLLDDGIRAVSWRVCSREINVDL